MAKKRAGERTVLAFDFGTISIGVAVGTELTRTASMLPALKAKDGIPDPKEMESLFKEWQPDIMVVGLPLNMDGSYQEVTYKAKKFGNRTSAKFGVQVIFKDERLSTKSAREHLFEHNGYRGLTKGKIDSMSAVVILEGFFEENA